MPRSTDHKADAIRLMASETNFERSVISGQQCRPDAAPRQEELPRDVHQELLAAIARDEITYIVFSYRTPIAWVYRSGAVNLPEIKHSKTTSMHQNWVREAFGDRVNRPGDFDHSADAPVVLSENEEIILRRMRDEDGTEYCTVMGYGIVPNSKKAPRDQVEPLIIKGLVAIRDTDYGVVDLTDKGRAHLDQIQPVAKQETTPATLAAQYFELSEDDLIGLLAEMTLGKADVEVQALVLALRARRDASAQSRRRIGEYLRQQAIVQVKYDRDMASDSDYSKRNAKEPKSELDSVRADAYAGTARLLLADIQRIVEPVVRDTETEFYAEQATRLSIWLESKEVSEKQAALLPCIAQGHITTFGNSYTGKSRSFDEQPCTCVRPDGRTVNALKKKGVITFRAPLGYGHSATAMLARPKTA